MTEIPAFTNISMKIKKAACFILYLTRITTVAKWYNRKKKRIPILMYHNILKNPRTQRLRSCLDLLGMVVSADTFETHIKYLSRHFNVISLETYLDYKTKNLNIPSDPVILTFDDGFMCNYTEALPILEKYNCTATFFVIGNAIREKGEVWIHRLYSSLDRYHLMEFNLEMPDRTDFKARLRSNNDKLELIRKLKTCMENSDEHQKHELMKQLESGCGSEKKHNTYFYKNEYMTAKEISELAKKGFTVGGHSMTHCNLASLQWEEKSSEISTTRFLLDQIVREKPIPFAYPYGQRCHFDNETKELLSNNRFSCGMTTIEGLNEKNSDSYELKRIEIGEFSNYELLTHITGLVALVKSLGKKILRRQHHS